MSHLPLGPRLGPCFLKKKKEMLIKETLEADAEAAGSTTPKTDAEAAARKTTVDNKQ